MTENEYNQCVDLYADNVYRFILKNLRHEADAKDIVQGAFEKMWMNREQVDNLRSKSYLFTVAYNQMIDHIRKNKRITLKEVFSEKDIKSTSFIELIKQNPLGPLLTDINYYIYDKLSGNKIILYFKINKFINNF
jgi:RNA polymerase sigma factor (sigma-70 family)